MDWTSKTCTSLWERTEKNKALQEAYDKLLEENKMLKSADNNDAAEKNEKSQETNWLFGAYTLL